MNTKTLWIGFLLLLLLPQTHAGFAQVSYQWTYHNAAGNPGGLNQEADFHTIGWNTLMSGSLLSNQWSNPGNIPFPFTFFGKQVTFFKVSANGLLTFDMASATPPNNNGPLPHPGVPDSTIACYWERFSDAPPIGSNDRVETKLFGTAPNRQLWIRWHSYEWGPLSFAYLAVVLEEGTNNIYLVDLFSSLNSNLVTSSVGIQANNSFAITAGSNIPLSGGGSSNADNSYYRFVPYQIEPYDMVAVSVDEPFGDACGLGQEQVSISLSNVGLFSATGMTARLKVDQGSWSSPETIPGSLAPGDTITYTFTTTANLSSFGQHDLQVVVEMPTDNNLTNDTIRTTVNNLISISQFPYQENFENGAGGWNVAGTNPSWQLGYANNPIIIGAGSGVNTWVTNRTGSYNANENSWVVGPCFDLTQAEPGSVLAMDVWWESELSWDGAVVQTSIDGGQTWQRVGSTGSGINWYNDQTINAAPGGQSQGWTGIAVSGQGSGGFVHAQVPLNANLLNEPQVLFRVAFASDGSQQLDGFAFDNVRIAAPPSLSLGQNGFFCNGTILDAGSANQNYDILWSNGSTDRTIVLNNFSGTPIIDSVITLRVIDEMGLISQDSITISMTVPPSVQVDQVRDVACFGDSTGEIRITMLGGASPFTYTWNHGATTQDISNLAPGTYSGSVIDINGCEAEIAPITVGENSALEATFVSDSVSCYGDANGQATITPAGGVGPYQVLWDVGGTSPTLTGLSAGTYGVSVTDDLGCSYTDSVAVFQPDSLALTESLATDAACIDAANGRIDITLAGGTAPYEFFWDHGSNAEDPDSLTVGTYSGYALDANGCQIDLPVLSISYTDSMPTAGFGFDMAGSMVGFKDSSAGASTYFWDFGDGDTSALAEPVHVYAQNGVFTVKQITSNPCGSDTLIQEVNIINASLGQDLEQGWRLYPNPSHGQFTLEFPAEWRGATTVTVYSTQGRLVWQQPIQLGNAQPVEFQLPPTLSRGLYLVQIQQGDRLGVQRLELR